VNRIRISHNNHPDFAIAIKKQSIPADPLYGNQYYLKPNSTNSNFHINVEKAWDITKGASTVKVAIIDDGVEAHEDLPNLLEGKAIVLENNGWGSSSLLANGGISVKTGGEPRDFLILPSYVFSGNKGTLGHGQAVAGIIGASHNNIGIAGIAPNVSIFPINVYTTTKPISLSGANRDWLLRFSGLAKAIDVARENNCHLINMSFDVLDKGDDLPDVPGEVAVTQMLLDAIKNAVNPIGGGKGIAIVAAIGNLEYNNSNVLYPAKDQRTIGVGASTILGAIQTYSKVSDNVDLVAPSATSTNDLWTIDRMGAKGYNTSGNYANDFGGTSASAPQVTGVAALMLSVNPLLTSSEIETILKAKAKNLGQPANAQGAGLVQACESVVEAVNRNLSISGSIGANNSQIVLYGHAAGFQSITWSLKNSLNVIIASGTGSVANISISVNSTATISFSITYNCTNPIVLTIEKIFQSPLSTSPISSGWCYRIKNLNSNKVMAVAGAQANNGALVWQVPQNNSQTNQIWKVIQDGPGNYYKILAQHTNKAMEVMYSSINPMANIQQNDYTGASNQKFKIEQFYDLSLFYVSPKHMNGGFNLDISGNSNLDFAPIVQNPYNVEINSSQMYYFENATCPTAPYISTCGMSITNTIVNCNTGNPNVQNIIEDISINGAGSGSSAEPLQYRADAGNWLDYCWLIQNLSPGNHTIYVRKKNNTTCQTSTVLAVCSGTGGNGNTCPTPGCLWLSGVLYNTSTKILEVVNTSGGSGQYQYAIDGCGNWLNYQWLIQNLSNGNHTVYVRDKLNIACGGQFTFSVTGNNFCLAATDAINKDVELLEGLVVFPNPSTNEITITFQEEKGDNLKLDILSITGKVFKTLDLIATGEAQKVKVDVNNLQAGSFVVSLKSSKSVKSKIILKE
jgi:hypothetical protein